MAKRLHSTLAVLVAGVLVAPLLSGAAAAAEPDVPVAPTTTVAEPAPPTSTTDDTSPEPDAALSVASDGEIQSVAEPVPGEYIVTLANVSSAAVADTAGALGAEYKGEVFATYRSGLRGFAVAMTEEEALALSADPKVAAVEENAEVHAITTQNGATWGLDRIDQRDLPLDTTYNHDATGTGVDAYIVDSGIRITHQEFGGRASSGFDFVNNDNNADDCNGHGTHVAGTVGGTTFGVAKNVNLIAVRVLDCAGSGSSAGLLSGIDFVTQNHTGPTVANMSLGFNGVVQSIDDAVTASIAAGVSYALAAGNSNVDACGSSPGRTPNAITVGSTTMTDARSSFSNFGTCVDIFAPGSDITSAGFTDDTATNTISGTSMAAPHVAGVAALVLQAEPNLTPAQVAARLVADSTPNKVTNPGTGSPNRLLFTGNITLAASLTVVQDSIADSAQDFGYTATCVSGPCGVWSMDDDANNTLPRSVKGENIPNGNYVITQAAVPGWTLSSIVCNTGEAVDLANRRVTVTITTNEQVTCTFTNRSASITLVQQTVPDGSQQDFSFQGCQGGCGAAFPLDDDPASATPGTASGTGLVPGTFVVTQAAVTGWTLSSLVCDTGEVIDLANRRATITLGPTEHATCTWTNTSASIAIVQDSVPDEAQDYVYTGCLGAGCSTFSLDDDANATLPRQVRGEGLAPGTYTLTQAAVAGRELSALVCNTGESINLANRQATVTLTAGEQVVCTFSNRLAPPANDDFANAQVLNGASGTTTGTTVNATRETREPVPGLNPTRSVWYRWQAPANGTVTIDTCGGTTAFDTLLGVYTGTAVNGLAEVVINDDGVGCTNFHSKVTFTATSGTIYRIVVDGYEAANGPFTLDWALV